MARAPAFRRDEKSWPRVLFYTLAVALVLWAIGLFEFAGAIPNSIASLEVKTDAIVVLTGGSGRVQEGIDLMDQGRSKKLFVSGVYKGLDVASLLELSKKNPGELSCCIGIGYAEDTITNALETRDWARDNAVKSIRLVTSAYHMPRAMLEFKNVLVDITVIKHPVFTDHVKQERWWSYPGTTMLIISEYNKFILAWLRHRMRDVLIEPPLIK